MAYVIYQSNQSATGTTGTLAISKPASLAVGDVMVAAIMGNSGTSVASTGWTVAASKANTVLLVTLTKVADAGDVAASSFTFTFSGGTPTFTHGAISRFSSAHTTPVDQTGSGSGSGTSVSFGGITPTAPNSLFMICLAYTQNSGAGNPSNTSAQAVATSNPTWTEIYDSSTAIGGGSYVGLSIAYASRSPLTATGSVTATYSVSTSAYAGIVLNIAPALVPALSLATGVPIANTPYGPAGAVQLASALNAPTFTEVAPDWLNTAKSDADWTNIPKS